MIVVDPPVVTASTHRDGRAPQPRTGVRAAGGRGPRARGRGLPPAALRRRGGRVPRGRRVQHVLRRPLRPRPRGARARATGARSRSPPSARATSSASWRCSTTSAARPPSRRPTRSRRSRSSGPDMRRLMLQPAGAGGGARRLARAPPAHDQRAARQPVLPDRPVARGERDRPARRAGAGRGRARRRTCRSPPPRPSSRCSPAPRASPLRGSWRRSSGQG